MQTGASPVVWGPAGFPRAPQLELDQDKEKVPFLDLFWDQLRGLSRSSTCLEFRAPLTLLKIPQVVACDDPILLVFDDVPSNKGEPQGHP